MDNKKKVTIIAAVAVVVLILIGIIATIMLKSKETSKNVDNNISQEQQTDKIVLKAKAKGKALKFSVSFEDIQNVEFNIEKSYNEEFDNATTIENSYNNNEAEDDLTADIENNVEKCFYRVKAKINNGDIIYSNIVTIQLKKPSSNTEDENVEDSINNSVEDENKENNDDNYIDIFDEYDDEYNYDSDDGSSNDNNEYIDDDSIEDLIELDPIVSNSEEQLVLSESEISLDLSGYKTTTLIATISPENVENKTINWSSSNDSVATVSGNGKVTARGNGSAIITAKTENGTSEECQVNVTTSATGISLNETSINLDILNNRNKTLIATVNPSTTIDKTVIWSSSNENIVEVDSNGNITANSNGTATITVETPNGKKATCQVSVTTAGSGIYLNKTSLEFNLSKNTQAKLIATVLPTNSSNKSIAWSSSNTKVAVVDANGNVTAKAVGTAVITAKMSNGKSSSCKVVVNNNINVQRITLDKTSLVLFQDITTTVTATVSPTNATKKTLTYSSSNPNVANVSISPSGTIQIAAKQTGSTLITIKATDGSNVTSQINVEVLSGSSSGYYKYGSTVYKLAKTRIDLTTFLQIVNTRDLSQFGKEPYPDKCLSFAYSYSYFLAEKTPQDLYDVNKANIANYKYGSFKNITNDNKNVILQKMYDEIERGYPPVIQVNGNASGTSRHYVTVIGYNSNVTSKSNLKESDFLIIDVASTGDPLKVLTKAKGGYTTRYMITGYNTGRQYGYQVYISNRNPVS